jgi:plasmid maintenance system antidote protein VapI
MSVNVGKCIKIAQAINDVSNIDLAKEFGVKPQQVIRWRTNDDMSVNRAIEISKFFGMTFEQFLSLGNAKS